MAGKKTGRLIGGASETGYCDLAWRFAGKQGLGSVQKIISTLVLSTAIAFGSAGVTTAQEPVAATGQRIAIPISKLGRTEGEAFLNIAKIALRNGQIEAAGEMAAKAYSKAKINGIKYEAAMIAAQSAIADERLTAAQLWLRRADQFAPNPRAKAIVAKAYRGVAVQNPFSFQFQFAAGPSDNVNNGTDNTIIIIGGLPFEVGSGEGPLDGFEAEVGLTFGYRLAQSRTQKTSVLAQLFQRRVWLSDESRAEAPDVDAADYENTSLVVGLQHDTILWPEIGPSGLGVFAGQGWYARETLSNWVELQVKQDFRLKNGGAIRVNLSGRSENRLDDAARSSTSVRGGATWRSASKKGLARSLGFSLGETWSESALVDKTTIGLNASHSLGTIGPLNARIEASLSSTDFRKWSVTSDGRIDDSANLTLSATIPDLQFFGFIPRFNIGLRHTDSNVDIYDREEFSFGLTGQSRF